ncbi:transmembrane protein 39A [Phlebotomus argentipes]|uniref:transmembrane protein 39A n=1 Tax=Phlebotomus argentipes TaxID=94469 RepID=UPI0028935824|nr:transmembrane protein 39A [Phlebotomus argentipes]
MSSRRFARPSTRTLLPPVAQNLTGVGEKTSSFASLPKHTPFPDVSHPPEFINELIMFIFVAIAASAQFLHLYRTGWWLEDSFVHETMNFYLIDKYLVMFIVTILSRRVIFLAIVGVMKLSPWQERVVSYVYFGFLSAVLLFCSVQLYQKSNSMYLFCLCYPLLVYLIIFGARLEPFLKTIHASNTVYLGGTPLHCCSTNPSAIRDEVEVLKSDFNNRFKQVIFTSACNAYYAGFIPCCFSQAFLYYDLFWATQHLTVTWLSAFTAAAAQCFPTRYCDVLHRAALHLGQWNRIDNKIHAVPALTWSKNLVWPAGALIKHSGDFYKATGSTAAIPTNASHFRFHWVFRNPSNIYLILFCGQLLLVVLQIALVVLTHQWQNMISMGFLILTNQFTLYRHFRSYLISHDIYNAELQATDCIRRRLFFKL